ncbi:hypothetical protein PAUR_a2166 [Pseudoalteromonas aurantia 208]|uniref:Uncharacterized protein n=1 Tax=Pseudoalteromonas aurantia 208 TaxID=1314867 RepID=A0ABR9EC19_9GAMM|nr:hypothetical protein [Pseudoalteromonas aurantia 208]
MQDIDHAGSDITTISNTMNLSIVTLFDLSIFAGHVKNASAISG